MATILPFCEKSSMSHLQKQDDLVAVFLGGSYRLEHATHYQKLASRAAKVVASDGTMGILKTLKIMPDVVVGDFDSEQLPQEGDFSGAVVRHYPAEKDKTDGELALEEALLFSPRQIEICGTLDDKGETDHLLGNLFLLGRFGDRGVDIKIAESTETIFFLSDRIVEIAGRRGDGLSLIPVSTAVRVSYTGLLYPLRDQIVEQGSTRGLRNVFSETTVSVKVEGKAFVIQKHAGPDR